MLWPVPSGAGQFFFQTSRRKQSRMTESTLGESVGAKGTTDIQNAYMAMARTKRMYGGIILIVFIALMVSGFMLADSRNAGGFWDGILNIFKFYGEVVKEASEKISLIP